MHRTSQRFLWLLALSAILALGAGCGDDDSESTDDTTGTGSTPDPTPEPEPSGSEAADDTALTARQVPVIIDVLANDTLVGTWDIVEVTEPSSGRVEITSTGELRFTPDPSETAGGSAELTYTAALRGAGETLTATVEVTILSDLGTVSGGQLYTAVDDSVEEEPLGFQWVAISDDGTKLGGDWTDPWFIVRPDGTRVTAPAPEIGDGESISYGGLLDFGANNSVVGFYAVATEDLNQYQLSVSWDGGDSLTELSSGVFEVYGTNANGLMVGTNIGVFPDPYSGIWLDSDGDAEVFDDHPDPTVGNTVFFDINDNNTVVGYTEDDRARCFLVEEDRTVVELEAPFTADTWVRQRCFGINNQGELVGAASRGSYTDSTAFRVTPDGTFHPIVFPFPRVDGEEGRDEEARAINESGVIVGTYTATENVLEDEETVRRRVRHPVTLTPVEALAGTRFEDTPYTP